MSTSYGPLRDPDDALPPKVSVTIARGSARQVLAYYETANVFDHEAMVQAAAALDASLRSLLDALDTERGERP